jgi:hypothetical protein
MKKWVLSVIFIFLGIQVALAGHRKPASPILLSCEVKALEIGRKLWGPAGFEFVARFERANFDRESQGLESWLVLPKNRPDSGVIRVVFEKLDRCHLKAARVLNDPSEDPTPLMELLGSS